MIIFDLMCGNAHKFEAWFRSSEGYQEQKKAGEIACPLCGDCAVEKAVMAPNISPSSRRAEAIPYQDMQTVVSPAEGETLPTLPENLRSKFDEAVNKVRDHLEKSCDYVGDQFPEEARKIHYGEAEQRNIYGEASVEESENLSDEGIEVVPLPFISPKRTDA